MSILRIKDKDGNWVEIPSLNVEVNRKSVRAAIPTLVEYIKDSNSPFVALDGESIPIGRIASGAYRGTGAYGEGNSVVLTFDFEPKIVWVTEIDSTYGGADHICMFQGISSARFETVNAHKPVTVIWGGNSVYFYSTETSTYQLNGSGKGYAYYVIG